MGTVALSVLAACAGATDSSDHRTRVSDEPVAIGGAALPAMALRVRVAHTNRELGVPSFAWLTGSSAPTRTLALRRGVALAPKDVAWSTLRGLAPTYKLNAASLAATRLARLHDTGKGAVIAQFTQAVDGIDVFRSGMNVALTRELEPVAASGFLAPVVKAHAGESFALDGDVALGHAFRALTGKALTAGAARYAASTEGGYDQYTVQATGDLQVTGARAKKVWFAQPAGLASAYYVELMVGAASSTDADMHAFVVSATTGAVLFRKNLTAADSYSYRVWAGTTGNFAPHDGPQGNGAVPHPTATPNKFIATLQAPALVTLANSPYSKNDPWLPAGAQETIGNNVTAYADLKSPNGFGAGDVRANVTAAGVFGHLADLALGPASSEAAIKGVVTQLFYDVNFMHDYFYDAGFDEASGNPQTNNLGRGGIGNDAIIAEAQDYSGRNNANASTPADGAPPRIQMYLFDGEGQPKTIVTAPAEIAGTFTSRAATFSPETFTVTGSVVQVNDGTGTLTDGCETPFTNAAAVAGKIALIDRGTCTFVQKVTNAKTAGAIGVLIVNNQAGGAPSMPAAQGAAETLPTLSLSQANGATIKGALASGVTVTLKRDKAIDRDGALDTAIITHEWGHVLSNRLVANGSGLDNSQGGGMGEGWADFVALLVTVREDDLTNPTNANYAGAYPVGGYAMSGSEPDGYYYGVRRYPYSTDMTKNPLTYKHIGNGTPLPSTAPVAFGEDGADNAEVHSTGEVWAVMLWECYAALLRDTTRLTFAQANERMRAYLVASLKLTPGSPTILEARDAVLAAAGAADPKDFVLFAAAFAKRGAGTGATGPDSDSTDHRGVKESFVTGNDLSFVSGVIGDVAGSCDTDSVLDNGEKGTLTIKVKNIGTGALSETTAKVTSSSTALTFANGGAITFPASTPFQEVTATLEVSLTGAAPVTPIEITVETTDPKLTIPRGIKGTVSALVNFDVAPASSATDSVEASETLWKTGGVASLDVSEPWERIEDGANHRWYIANNATVSDQWLLSPAVKVAATGPFVVSFKHRYSFEKSQNMNFDGGVIELSSDAGKTWKDIGAAATPGYSGALETNRSDNPLKGRNAFVAESAGYPAFVDTTVDLGEEYAGQTVQVRFRVATDDGTSANGWDLDDIGFKGIEGTPFSSLVANACEPVAGDAGAVDPGLGADGGGNGAAPGGDVSGGCGCTTAGSSSGSGASLAMGALGLLAAAFTGLRRSRRRAN